VPYLPDESLDLVPLAPLAWLADETQERARAVGRERDSSIQAERRRNRFNAANRRKASVADRRLGRLNWAGTSPSAHDLEAVASLKSVDFDRGMRPPITQRKRQSTRWPRRGPMTPANL
jgi:hypothetical protein